MKEEPKDLLEALAGIEAAQAITVQKDKLKEKEMVRPFSCGSDYGDWQHYNCHNCSKYDEDVEKSCSYERELGLAYCTDGTIRKNTAKKLGLPKQFNCKNKKELNK